MRKSLWGLLLCLLALQWRAQHKRDTLRLYYAINQTDPGVHAKRLDSLAVKLKDKVVAFWVFGYADFLNHDNYNRKLSAERARKVQQYITRKFSSPHLSFVAVEGRGESQSTDSGDPGGEPRQRRVDVVFEVSGPRKEIDTRPRKVMPPRDSAAKKRKIEELSAGESVDVEGLSFQPGRHVLLQSSMPALRKLLRTLQENPKLKIEIQGHICCSPPDQDGLDYDTGERLLSVNRAKAVYDYLVSKGIEASRLKYAGYGHSQPKVTPETTPEEEQLNRRVEILILDK